MAVPQLVRLLRHQACGSPTSPHSQQLHVVLIEDLLTSKALHKLTTLEYKPPRYLIVYSSSPNWSNTGNLPIFFYPQSVILLSLLSARIFFVIQRDFFSFSTSLISSICYEHQTPTLRLCPNVKLSLVIQSLTPEFNKVSLPIPPVIILKSPRPTVVSHYHLADFQRCNHNEFVGLCKMLCQLLVNFVNQIADPMP